MRLSSRTAVVFLGLSFIAAFAAAQAAGGGKASPFKQAIPDAAVAELKARSLKKLAELAKTGSDEAIQLEAALLYATLQSAKTADAKLAESAKTLAALAGAKTPEAKKLAADLTKAPAKGENAKYLPTVDALMEPFQNKAKKGEGLNPGLHYQPKIKNQDGIEALISALAAKPLSETNVGKVASELPLLAYRISAYASLTHEAAGTHGAKWIEFSDVMRDSSFELAEAARAKNAEGIHKASTKLETSCIACHKAFRK